MYNDLSVHKLRTLPKHESALSHGAIEKRSNLTEAE